MIKLVEAWYKTYPQIKNLTIYNTIMISDVLDFLREKEAEINKQIAREVYKISAVRADYSGLFGILMAALTKKHTSAEAIIKTEKFLRLLGIKEKP